MIGIQRPLDWIAKAFRLRAGDSPNTLLRDIQPTLDVMQGGWAQGDWRYSAVTGGVGALASLTIPPDAKLTRLVRMSCFASAAGASTLQVTISEGVGPVLSLYSEATAATTPISWDRIAGSMPFWVVQPNQFFSANFGPIAGQTCSIVFNWLEVPAGTKPL